LKIYSKFDNGFPQGKNMKRELMEKRKPEVAFQAEKTCLGFVFTRQL